MPKAMTELAFEGAEPAFIDNGDRFEPVALSPRRKPRTDFFPVGAALPVNQLYLQI